MFRNYKQILQGLILWQKLHTNRLDQIFMLNLKIYTKFKCFIQRCNKQGLIQMDSSRKDKDISKSVCSDATVAMTLPYFEEKSLKTGQRKGF